MSERTDEERGTIPETTDDWVRDLEGDSDVSTPPDAAETPDTEAEAEIGEADPSRGAGGA